MSVPAVICENCGKPADEHWAVNYANGPHITGSVLVCPTSVFVVHKPMVLSRGQGETTP